MTQPNEPAQTIACTPQEIRELRSYVRTLEAQLDDRNKEIAGLRAARSLRIARALRQFGRQPLAAARALRAALRPIVPPGADDKPAHRHFGVFSRAPSAPPALPASKRYTLLSEILQYCAAPEIVELQGAHALARPDESSAIRVTPHDFESKLASTIRPALLVDPDAIRPDSPWYGLMSFDDMRLNRCLAQLLEHMSRRGGRSFIVRPQRPERFPLLDDFAAAANLVDSIDAPELAAAGARP